MREGLAIAAAHGIDARRRFRARLRRPRPISPHKSSMLQDFERNRPPEIDGILTVGASLRPRRRPCRPRMSTRSPRWSSKRRGGWGSTRRRSGSNWTAGVSPAYSGSGRDARGPARLVHECFQQLPRRRGRRALSRRDLALDLGEAVGDGGRGAEAFDQPVAELGPQRRLGLLGAALAATAPLASSTARKRATSSQISRRRRRRSGPRPRAPAPASPAPRGGTRRIAFWYSAAVSRACRSEVAVGLVDQDQVGQFDDAALEPLQFVAGGRRQDQHEHVDHLGDGRFPTGRCRPSRR